MTDQRNRVTTDPGLGPVQREHASTLRSMTVADPVPDDEVPGAPVYYEPKPLHAVSEHKTLELETVKLAKDIDPRKLPTELKLRRPVLHVLPASDPNWPAPEAQDLGWPPPQFDSGWPPPETVLTSSQPPLAARRRSYIPLVLLVLLAASVLLVLGARARRRLLLPTATAQAMQPLPAPALAVASAAPNAEPTPSTPASASSEAASVASAAAAPAESAESPEAAEAAASALASANAAASATAAPSAIDADPNTVAAPTRPADAPHHATFKPVPPSNANSQSSALPTAKPKRAIY